MAGLKYPKPEKRQPKARKPIARGSRPRALRRRNDRGLQRTLADDFFSLFVRTRDKWKCRRCGKGPLQATLQCAHVLPKGSYPAVRYDEANAICLCHGCHRYFTNRWIEWRNFVEEHGITDPQALLNLYALRKGVKLDYSLEITIWARRCADLEGFEYVRERWEELIERGRKLNVLPR